MNKASAPVSFREDTPAAEGWDGVPNLTYPGHVVGDGKISFNRAAAGAPDEKIEPITSLRILPTRALTGRSSAKGLPSCRSIRRGLAV